MDSNTKQLVELFIRKIVTFKDTGFILAVWILEQLEALRLSDVETNHTSF